MLALTKMWPEYRTAGLRGAARPPGARTGGRSGYAEQLEHDAEPAPSVVDGGSAWLGTVRLDGRAALRACVSSFRTTRADLVRTLNHARSVRW